MRAFGKRVSTVVTCEALEPRQLLATTLPVAPGDPTAPPKAPSLFIEPQDGRTVILQAIASARKEIRLGICNLSDPIIGHALAAAAARGVDVRVIVDRADYSANAAERQLLAQISSDGVSVHLSNPIFQQSFEKDLVIDRRTILIMTMCLEPATFEDTRDYGLVLARPDIIGEATRVFDNDWAYTAPIGVTPPPYNPTPPLHVPDLMWSPIDSSAKLTNLIEKARHSIDATTELLDDPFLESALIAAAHRGVQIRLILPSVPRDGASNTAGIDLLASQGVNLRVTYDTSPPPGAPPYMHAKTMIVDGRLAYLGSIDLDLAATSDDRELGVLFRQPSLIRQLRAQFLADWAVAHPVSVATSG